MTFVPLAYTTRNQRVESIYQGLYAVVTADGALLRSAGDPDYATYLRSAIKMIQAMPIIESGAAERFALSAAELAICCASHTAADYHVKTVRGLLGKLGLGEGALKCGGHLPEDREMRERLIRMEGTPTAIYNNCSGKHAGMLASCIAHDWPLETYLDPDHPLQQRIFDLIADYAGLSTERIGLGIDGCSLPTYFMPVRNAALMAARFIDRAAEPGSADRRLLDAIAAHPEMIQAEEGFDSVLIRSIDGDCYAKRGAMGIMLIGMRTEAYGAIGIGIKIADGEGRPMPVVALAILEELDLLSDVERERLASFSLLPLKNWNGIHVGDMRPAEHDD